MSTAQKTDKSAVVMKAYNNACDVLGINTTDKSSMLGVNASTLSRNAQKGFSPQSKTGELQLHFIRVYRSLFAIAGGDNEFMLHWYHSNNIALNGVPAALCLSIEGLLRTNQYLDAMRAKV